MYEPEHTRESGEDETGALCARFLSVVPELGNLLPHPVTLFALVAFGVVTASASAAAVGLEMLGPRPRTVSDDSSSTQMWG